MPSARALVRVAALLALVATAAGCSWDGPATTLVPRSDLTRSIHGVYAIITWASVIIGLAVMVVLGIILFRFRDGGGTALPRQIRGHSLLEISWTIAPALILLVIAIPTIQVIFRTQGAADPRALEIVVLGKQWWWEFRYPALGLVTANEMHVPVGQPVNLRLEGFDVIHSFWVPQIAAKRDIIPGRQNRITFTADTPGEYWGQCAEFCGTSHANMLMRVFVDTRENFERWVAQERAPAGETPEAAAPGKALYTSSACVGCHTIRGVSAGVLGPDLTHFGSRATLGAGLLPNRLETLTLWLKEPAVVKPGVKMPNLNLTDDQARALATYLLSLK